MAYYYNNSKFKKWRNIFLILFFVIASIVTKETVEEPTKFTNSIPISTTKTQKPKPTVTVSSYYDIYIDAAERGLKNNNYLQAAEYYEMANENEKAIDCLQKGFQYYTNVADYKNATKCSMKLAKSAGDNVLISLYEETIEKYSLRADCIDNTEMIFGKVSIMV